MNVSSVWDRLDRDLVIQEAMYGCIMALTIMLTAYVGIMHYSDRMHLNEKGYATLDSMIAKSSFINF